MKVLKNILTGISALTLITGFSSCNDVWDDHYGNNSSSAGGDISIYEIIASNPDLQDFKQVIDSVRIFSNNRMTEVKYSDLLKSGQFMTVWAPKNGTFNKDSLLIECQTSKGDSLVEQYFIKNHIAKNKYSYSSVTKGSALMSNKKLLEITDGKLGTSNVENEHRNIVANNGILHIVDSKVPYFFNLYEGLTSLDEFSHIGDFLLQYQELYFDKDNSLASGIVDGQTVYVDSVFRKINKLLWSIGDIESEDSLYWMVVPDKKSWEMIYDSAFNYFNYADDISKKDSLQNYWVNYSLIQDFVFNPKVQKSIADSLMSTTYNTFDSKYHVYYNPYGQDGILGNVNNEMLCSNGNMYKLDYWPYDFREIFFKPIKVEAERASSIIKYDYGTYTTMYASGDTISGNRFLKFNCTNNSAQTYMQYNIPNTLSGKYDLSVVILPLTVVYPDDKNKHKPFLFDVELTYLDKSGKSISRKFTENYNNVSPKGFVNNPFCVDTVHIGTIDLPTCNYSLNNIAVTVKVTSTASARNSATYLKNAYMDFIYLEPHVD